MKQLRLSENSTTYNVSISKKRLFIMVGMLSVKCDLTDLDLDDENCIISNNDRSFDLLLTQENYQLVKDAVTNK